MPTVLLDRELSDKLRAERAQLGLDRYDEIWEGTYMMASMPNNEHQKIVSRLTRILEEVVGENQHGDVFPGVNVSDRYPDWKRNYRIPDVAVFLPGTAAVDRGSCWQGGPDFAIEILSPDDQSRQKLEFYASVKTGELLLIDREPWQLELYRLEGTRLQKVAVGIPGGDIVVSNTTGLQFELRRDDDADADDRPLLIVGDGKSGRTWTM